MGKRIFSLVLAILLGVLLVSGCSKKENDIVVEKTESNLSEIENSNESRRSLKEKPVLTSAKGFTYEIEDNAVTIVDYFGEESSVEVPEMIQGLSVTKIAKDSFRGKRLISVSFPNTIKEINCDFYGCDTLSEISIPNGVKWVGLSGCTAYYKNINNWENGLLYVNDHLIACKKDVTNEVYIKSGTKYIGDSVFKGCSLKCEISIPDSVVDIADEAFYSSDFTKIVIGNGVKNIGKNAFCYCKANEIVFGNSIETIEYSAFSFCNNLSNVSLNDGVKTIGNSAFSYCENLENISLPDSIVNFGGNAFGTYTELGIKNKYVDNKNNWDNGTLYIGNYLVCAPSKISDGFIVREGTIGVGDGAFSCSKLSTVTLPESLVSIGENAFYYCQNLTTVNFPNNIVRIGPCAFYNTSISTVKLPSKLESIEDKAFGETKIKSMVIPKSIKKIGESIIGGSEISEIEIEDSDNDIFIGESALSNSSLKKVKLGNGVNYISKHMFSGCCKLTEIIIADSVKEIRFQAFSGCTSLENIVIPQHVNSIDCFAFSGCTSLKNITIYDEVSYIDVDAFDDTAFYNDSNNWNNNVLYLGNHLIKIKKGGSISGLKENTRCIANDALYDCQVKGEFVLPDSITGFGSAFSVTEITSLTIGDNVKKVCVNNLPSSLEKLTVGAGVEILPYGNTKSTVIDSVVINSEFTKVCYLEAKCVTAPNGSYAQQYAIDNDIAFCELT